MTCDLGALLYVCLESARVAAIRIRQIAESSDMDIQTKGPGDYVTKADFASQSIITGFIRHYWPDIQIIGEENPHLLPPFDIQVPPLPQAFPYRLRTIPLSSVVVYVDPLDATSSFVRKDFEKVSILIGIVVDNQPYAGIIHFPFKFDQDKNDISIFGAPEIGIQGTQIAVPPTETPKIAVTESLHRYKTKEYADLFGTSDLFPLGGMGSKIAAVISGTVTVALSSPYHGSCLWDICAGEAILRAGGGELMGVNGVHYTYPSTAASNLKLVNGVLAFYPEHAQKFVDVFQRNMKEHEEL